MNKCEHCGDTPTFARVNLDRFNLLIFNQDNELVKVERGEFCLNCLSQLIDEIPPNWVVSSIPLNLDNF